MEQDRWERLDAILDQALDLPVDERAPFLERSLPDPEDRARVERLLELGMAEEGLLSGGGALEGELGRGFAAHLEADETPGDSVDGYEFVRLLGTGGMGQVWEAQQTKPVRRRVAIKIVRPQLDTGQVVARFESERQTLALMNHPGIAQVYDAGVTRGGRPYFAMEIVDGHPLTTFCDDAGLSIRERLRLFVEVCEAIQHAHQKGVIHRDLKPSNVLVTRIDGRPAPKVIDFGIARLVEGPASRATLLTQTELVIGTPEYMSPEQAGESPADVDTRSDVYSLGVLLYELLTGSLPHQRTSSTPRAMLDLFEEIKATEAPLPSRRIASMGEEAARVAVLRGTDTWGLSRKLRRDLDWITTKALAKDRARRYESVGEFAEDIRRFMRDEPAEAGPPGAAYRLRKFVRRNSGLLAATAAVLLALVAGLVGTMTGLVRAQREAERAQTQAAIAGAVNDFLNEDLLSAASPEELGREVTMQEVLATAAERLEGRFTDQPVVESSIRATMGQTYFALGRLDEASTHLERAIELRRRAGSGEDTEALKVMHLLGELRFYQGRPDEAAALVREVLAGRERLLGSDHRLTISALSDLGAILQATDQLDGAERCYREAHARAERSLEPTDPHALAILHNLGALLHDLDQEEQAEIHLRQALEGSRSVLGEEHPETLTTHSLLGSVLRELGRLDEAEVIAQEVLAIRRRVLGEEHHATLTSANNLAMLLEDRGKMDEAIAIHRHTLEVERRTLGDDHDATILSMGNLGSALTRSDRAEEALPLLREAVERCGETLGPDHSLCSTSSRKLGRSLLALDRLPEAETILLQAYETSRANNGADHTTTRSAVELLSELYRKWGRIEEAEAWSRGVEPES